MAANTSTSSHSVGNIINGVMEYYNAGIFFDNDIRHITEVNTLCNSIKTVKMPDTLKVSPVKKIDSRSAHNYTESDSIFTDYLSLPDFIDNMYVECVYEWGKYKTTLWDRISGITDEHIHLLHEWVEETTEIPNQ